MAEDNHLQNPHIAGFLRRNHIAVLATVHQESHEPHAAVLYYATDSHLNIYFLTKSATTKSINLASNPSAAMVVFESDTQRTAQITGQVSKVEDKDMLERALPLMSKFSKATAGTEETPLSKITAGDYVLYRLVPQSIRLAEYKYAPRNEVFDVATPAEESLE